MGVLNHEAGLTGKKFQGTDVAFADLLVGNEIIGNDNPERVLRGIERDHHEIIGS